MKEEEDKEEKGKKEEEEEQEGKGRRREGGGRSSIDMECTREWAWGYDKDGEVSIRQNCNALIVKNRRSTTH